MPCCAYMVEDHDTRNREFDLFMMGIIWCASLQWQGTGPADPGSPFASCVPGLGVLSPTFFFFSGVLCHFFGRKFLESFGGFAFLPQNDLLFIDLWIYKVTARAGQRRMFVGVRHERAEFRSQSCHWLLVWAWPSHSASLTLTFSTCKGILGTAWTQFGHVWLSPLCAA